MRRDDACNIARGKSGRFILARGIVMFLEHWPRSVPTVRYSHARWLEDGYLKKCSAVQAETDSYFEAQSTNDTWLLECCDEQEDFQTSAKELYASFRAFKEARGEGVLSQTRWGEWLVTRFTKSMANGRVYYRGLRVKPQSVLDFRP